MSMFNFFIEDCERIFQSNLSGILLLGSAGRDDTTPFSDLDVVVIIKTMSIDQVVQLRSVMRSSEGLLDCSILCQDELPNDPNNFCIGSHGCYQLELVLKQAECVWGQNILLAMARPTEHNIRLSVAHKVIEYTWWIRRMFIESNRERSLEINYKLNSRLIKIIRDILYLRGIKYSAIKPVRDVVGIFLAEYVEMLTDVERCIVSNLGDSGFVNVNTSNMSDEYLLARYSIANKIHKQVIQLVHVSRSG